MYVLNLDQGFEPFKNTLPNIEHEMFKFSGGETHIKLKSENRYSGNISVMITHRITDGDKLMEVLLAKDALEMVGFKDDIRLYIPYVPYARQDRLCNFGESFSLKIFSDVINNAGFNEVVMCDAHSDVAPAVINNSTNNTNHKYVEEVINDIGKKMLLVSPDSGANKKVNKLYSELINRYGLSDKLEGIVKCDKIRDLSTGKLSGFEVLKGDLGGQDCLIVDDICDGGGTFIGTAKELVKHNAGDIYLFVTHGIFSKGYDDLSEHFKKIYTTDSFKNINNDKVKQFKITYE